jgi:alanine-synthesizing transaminase
LDDGVLVQPGFFYDFEDEPVMVVSLLVPPRDFDEGARRIASRADRGVP